MASRPPDLSRETRVPTGEVRCGAVAHPAAKLVSDHLQVKISDCDLGVLPLSE